MGDDNDYCRFFLKGHCAFGKKCRNRHERPAIQSVSAQVVEEGSVASDDVCRFFLKGHCAFGKKCRNRHERPVQRVSAVSVQAVEEEPLSTPRQEQPREEAPPKNKSKVLDAGVEDNEGWVSVSYKTTRLRTKTYRPQPDISTEERLHRRERHAAFVAFYAEAQADKENITVSALNGIDFGVVEPGEDAHVVPIKIRKTNKEARIALHKFRLTSSAESDPKNGKWFSVDLLGETRWIMGVRTIMIKFSLASSNNSLYGLYEDTLELLFRDTVLQKNFIIVRSIAATIGSRADQEELKACSVYVPRPRTRFVEPGRVITVGRPPEWSATTFKAFLPSYDAPRDLIEAAYGEDGRPSMSTQEFRERFMPKEFNIKSYEAAFRVPLFIEEEKMRQDLDAYSMSGVTLLPEYPRYKLEVRGLAEGRPSVLIGDFILLKHTDSHEDLWYQGRVHFVYDNAVSLHMGENFSTYKGTKFDVRFVLNRLPHRRMHDAVHRCHGGHGRLLFSTPYHARKLIMPTEEQLREIVPFNRLVGSNAEQLSTVASILHMPPGSCPFVVFGPPGTGKTVTIVEAIRQLLDRDDKVKILICTPSNSAADLVTTKLIDIGPMYLCRLNSLSRKWSDLPEVLRPVSHYNAHNTFEIPSATELASYRVVVSTCISGSIPSGLKIPKGHFSHIFIDEAGQAKEPECMVPILTMADQATNVILAGDNQQLGPVLHSPLAGALGLKVSYLSRLMARPLYDLGGGEGGDAPSSGGRGLCIVKLLKNFRSHPSILTFPNEEFYRSELVACGDEVITRSLERVDELPKRGFPLIFHGIIGKDQREGSSPSFFNIEEATQVKKYCMELTSRGRKNRVDPKDIGVITPYHMQRFKLTTLLAKSRLQEIKVGSVEEFQGQERKVIILSTVRSSSENVMADIRRNLGFVAEPRRFNVAITRSRALLVVIGNPQILSLDPLWRSFLNYIHTNGGWRGQAINWNPTDDIRPGTQSFDSEVSKRVAQNQEEMMTRITELITRVERSDGFVVGEYPEGEEEEDEDVYDFVPERGTFSREDE